MTYLRCCLTMLQSKGHTPCNLAAFSGHGSQHSLETLRRTVPQLCPVRSLILPHFFVVSRINRIVSIIIKAVRWVAFGVEDVLIKPCFFRLFNHRQDMTVDQRSVNIPVSQTKMQTMDCLSPVPAAYLRNLSRSRVPLRQQAR
jgi:hypothetical protein